MMCTRFGPVFGRSSAGPRIVAMQTLIGLIFALLVVTAMVEDARRYRIPNWISLGLIAIFAARAAIDPGLPLGLHVLTAMAIFVTFFACYLAGWFGAGDVKLLSVVALWAGPQQLPLLLVVMALAGLVLGAFVLLARMSAAAPAARRWPDPLGRWADAGACPYGIAIGLGALAVAAGSWI